MDGTDQSPWRYASVTAIVIASMFLLAHVIDKGIDLATATTKPDVAPLLALLGAITTFVGSAIAAFFGVKAGQVGVTQATSAATVATQAAQAATVVATAAQKTAEAHLYSFRPAFTRGAKGQNSEAVQLRALQASHTNAIDRLKQLSALVPQTEQTSIASIVAAAPRDVTIKLTVGAGTTGCLIFLDNNLIITNPTQTSDTRALSPGVYEIEWDFQGAPGSTISIDILDASGQPLRPTITDALAPNQYTKPNSNEFFVT